ncbi:hypothetical protein B0T16DRAFT_508725 [Cercophora newfieldiana]|uniref:Uncharacterized protein n=1 Tax=Cercophora newfieldiana TaxID=92897 RepID=A0AA40CSN6_9PEZI|nr:hypothetical protein B0T16DRAFT_508725 [Cercophora newfieldiana]
MPSGIPVTAVELMDKLRELYWDSVRTEARNMIEFYVELRDSNLTLKTEVPFDACSETDRLSSVGSQSGFDEDSSSDLYKETMETARVEQVRLHHTSGQMTTIICGMTCSQCERLIRSPTFYECRENCEPRCFYEISEEASLARFRDYLSTASDQSAHPPFRVCSFCMTTAESESLITCDVAHLHETTYRLPTLENHPTICVKLNEAESRRRKQQNVNKDSQTKDQETARTRFIDKCLQSTDGLWPIDPRHFIRTAGLMMKGHYAPSGNFHLSLMFGPLIFESGLPKINHGVLISPRPPPAFFTDGGVGDVNDAWRKKELPFFYWDKDKKKPHLGKTDEVFRKPRPILACLKRVYSAAFSGYPESASQREAAVVACLIECGDRYATLAGSLKDTEKRREELGKLGDDLQSQLKICLGEEVDKHLSRIANKLVQHEERGEWSILTNNCQLLVNLLLSGEDFEYIIPLPPKDLRDQNFRWPRYLISFGNHIEGFGKSLYQPNCLMTQYNQSNRMVDYDLVEFMERCSEPHSKSLTVINQFLSRRNSGKDKDGNDETLIRCLDTLWALPGDTLSLLQFHFLRPPHKYPYHLDEDCWVKSRLRAMQLLDVVAVFTSALGNSLYRLFTRDPKLLSRITIPPARVLGNFRADEKLRIIDTLGPRGTFYDIVNRVPNAMSRVVEEPSRFWKTSSNAGDSDDPVHGEEVVCRIVGWFVAPLSAVSPALGAAIGGSFRLHENFWITVNVGTHTYALQYMCKEAKKVRDGRG